MLDEIELSIRKTRHRFGPEQERKLNLDQCLAEVTVRGNGERQSSSRLITLRSKS